MMIKNLKTSRCNERWMETSKANKTKKSTFEKIIIYLVAIKKKKHNRSIDGKKVPSNSNNKRFVFLEINKCREKERERKEN
jgi:hypothetical protein